SSSNFWGDEASQGGSIALSLEKAQSTVPDFPHDPQDTNEKPFIHPTCPWGKKLVLVIESTWGDPHYVGMAGLEIFNERGEAVRVKNPKIQVTADPPDINILPDFNSDPRTVDKLMDGVNHTCDDLHSWLAPFEYGKENVISVVLDKEIFLGALHLWNYNKSRTHSFRGVRCVIHIKFDDILIYKGQIRKATGTLGSRDCCCEVVSFVSPKEESTNVFERESPGQEDDTAD
ncbi:unnamed protein product, partial [Choristocarpus tenellus]